ncbi:RluA family pseudouridine synthase [Bacillus massilinigeriensis]|uniref:RluA family pseudouridine synthase n=1 Tax=Bacillus mediterraneensis TaxID=1805474 RepID=UPI0008F83A52|nr:RluA family pseudouridine synthase [Bacillus mediterraneensis]
MNNFKLRWKVSVDEKNNSLRDFLKGKSISRSALTDIKFKGGKLLVNEEEVTVQKVLDVEDIVEVIFPKEEPSAGIIEERFPLDILYEDDYFLVINKPAGMSTIPSREHPAGSLANGLIGYYREKNIEATTHIITRLDRDTSGIVLVAKHRHVHHLMSEQQKSGSVKRSYEALVEGILQEDEGVIEEPIARKPDSIIERHVHPSGQYACTLYKVIQRYQSFTHAAISLKTGRTHQIRVHMAHMGHPLVGDDLYGGTTAGMSRQALHCEKITFVHPFTAEEMVFTAKRPMDMQKAIEESKPI